MLSLLPISEHSLKFRCSVDNRYLVAVNTADLDKLLNKLFLPETTLVLILEGGSFCGHVVNNSHKLQHLAELPFKYYKKPKLQAIVKVGGNSWVFCYTRPLKYC